MNFYNEKLSDELTIKNFFAGNNEGKTTAKHVATMTGLSEGHVLRCLTKMPEITKLRRTSGPKGRIFFEISPDIRNKYLEETKEFSSIVFESKKFIDKNIRNFTIDDVKKIVGLLSKEFPYKPKVLIRKAVLTAILADCKIDYSINTNDESIKINDTEKIKTEEKIEIIQPNDDNSLGFILSSDLLSDSLKNKISRIIELEANKKAIELISSYYNVGIEDAKRALSI